MLVWLVINKLTYMQTMTNMPVNQSFFTIVGAGPVFGNQSILDVQFGTKDIIARDLGVGKLSPCSLY